MQLNRYCLPQYLGRSLEARLLNIYMSCTVWGRGWEAMSRNGYFCLTQYWWEGPGVHATERTRVSCTMREGLAGQAAEWICLVQCGGSGWEGRLIHAYMGLVQYWGEGLGG